jgi:hypothetical protein
MKQLIAILVLALMPAVLHAGNQETIEELKARANAADGKKHVELCVDVAKRQLKAADAAYTAGNNEQARAALADVVQYGLKAAGAAVATRKRMKHTEIDLRRIDQRLDAIRKSLDTDERPPVAEAYQKLEAARSELLNAMFRK